MRDSEFIAKPQVPSSHYEAKYDNRARWSSYWIQIEQVLNLASGPLLEVGVGSAVVTNYLRQVANRDVTTVDIDPDLSPDVVADIAELPFEDQTFECAMACEVLEHMPFEVSCRALGELRRVAKTAIISVPANDRSISATLGIGSGFWMAWRSLSLPSIRKPKKPLVEEEHFWELGMEGYSATVFEQAIRDAGWKIEKKIRNPYHAFHVFYILS